MKHFTSILQVSGFLLLTVLLSSCANKKDGAEEQALDMPKVTEKEQVQQKPQLPMRYQRPAYMIGDEIELAPVDEGDDVAIKVGKSFRSNQPLALKDILKPLAAIKDMNISWESDVDYEVKVDVDINAKDDFYKAIDNLLRQVDYFHVMQGDTIVVKHKETKSYHIGMPYITQSYSTKVGGNVLGGSGTSSGGDDESIKGTLILNTDRGSQAIGGSKGDKDADEGSTAQYDLWKNIEDNLNKILEIWEIPDSPKGGEPDPKEESKDKGKNDKKRNGENPTDGKENRRMSSNENLMIIDKSIGQITVTAPRPLLEKVDDYIDKLKGHLYKQIAIEAKILEVQIENESSIGIDWGNVLQDFQITGTMAFGGGLEASNEGLLWSNNSDDNSRFVSTVNIDHRGWTAFLSAIKKEGQTKILSNPKISVMNGQPAMISVGRTVTYIKEVTSNYSQDTGALISQTPTPESALSGVSMALTATIINENEIIMNLTPVTTELEEPIDREVFEGAVIGLPVINIREMSTTVKVRNGEMLVIGGLISDDKNDNSAFLPGTDQIPLVKYLFGHESKRKSKRELIILLKPVVI